MAITESLLVQANVLQDYLVDKTTGAPLSGGIIELYQDNARTVFKNWYCQTGSVGNYSFIRLANPLRLSATGTIQDDNGNDVIPFFYPYDETNDNIIQPYYIRVYSVNDDGSKGTLQFTRENFPYTPSSTTDNTDDPTLKNIITNNVFWRNIESLNGTTLSQQTTIGSTNYYYDTLVPSQHDGFSMPDMLFLKDVNGASDTLTFNTFASSNALNNDVTPEYYLNVECSSNGSSETVKVIQIPVSLHLKSLSNISCSVVLQNQANTANPNNLITLRWLQYTGTGATSTPNVITIDTIIPNNDWTKTVISTTTPDASNITAGTLGQGQDDALYLQIAFPVGKTFDINIAKPAIYLSRQVPENDVQTYDQVDAFINSPRTGDIRTSLNKFQPFGWVLCNDGVISKPGSTPPAGIPVARANADTWPLYNLLWTSTNAAVCPIYDSSGASTTRGASAILDFNAGKQLTITKMLGRTLIGMPPLIDIKYDHTVTPSWSTVAGVFTASNTALIYAGSPIYLTGTMPTAGNFTANTVYYAIPSIDGSSTTEFQLAATYSDALAGTAIAAGSASDDGADILLNFALGAGIGESRHVQLEGELATHNHPGSSASTTIPVHGSLTGGAFSPTTTNQSSVVFNLTPPITLSIANDGNNNPFNIMQPSVYVNVFLKL